MAAFEETRVDVASGTVTYVGKAVPGSSEIAGVWMLQRITSDVNGGLKIEYPNGSAFYNYAWSQRASYTYGES